MTPVIAAIITRTITIFLELPESAELIDDIADDADDADEDDDESTIIYNNYCSIAIL